MIYLCHIATLPRTRQIVQSPCTVVTMGSNGELSFEEKSSEDTMEFKSRSKRVLVAVAILIIFCIALTAGLLIHFLGRTQPEEIAPTPLGLRQAKEISPTPHVVTQSPATQVTCNSSCVFKLVESIPEGLNYPKKAVIHQPTGPTILKLIGSATETIHVASFYWTLRENDTVSDSTAKMGQSVFDKLYNISKDGNVKIQIVQNQPTRTYTDVDTKILSELDSVEVRNINFQRLVGAGILHTKMLMVDNKHFYVGSANFDWRSLTQVKELGVLVENCSCLAADIEKIFQVYWELARENATVPTQYSGDLATSINLETPALVANTSRNRGSVYLSSSPPQLCPKGRTSDIDAIIDAIKRAEKFVYIAVMDYMPALVFHHPELFWPVIDDALRSAAFDRKVTVRLMASMWAHTKDDMLVFLRSLNDISNMHWVKVDLEVKLFEVPTNVTLNSVPYSRVNHNKYMVTDRHAYIGTSNWSGDYFVSTGGIGFVMEQPNTNSSSSYNLRHQLVDVFLRDWNSSYAHPLDHYAT